MISSTIVIIRMISSTIVIIRIDAFFRKIAFVTMAEDLGVMGRKCIVSIESSGANCIAKREGACKAQHIEMLTLWLQDALIRKALTVRNIDGKSNPADIGANVLTSAQTSSSILERPVVVPCAVQRKFVKSATV